MGKKTFSNHKHLTKASMSLETHIFLKNKKKGGGGKPKIAAVF